MIEIRVDNEKVTSSADIKGGAGLVRDVKQMMVTLYMIAEESCKLPGFGDSLMGLIAALIESGDLRAEAEAHMKSEEDYHCEKQ